MMKLASAAQMREGDRLAMDVFGVPGLVLMENAGRAVVEVVARRYGIKGDGEIAVLAGPGNNGGDALVIARHLHQRGARSWVLLLVEPERLTGDAAANFSALRELSVPVEVVTDSQRLQALQERVLASRLVVDGIFGTGLSRELSGRFRAAVELLNRFSGPVIAVDAPSGLDSDHGRVLGAAVRADCTVTFALAKPGLVTFPGREWAGVVEVVDIGIPPEVYRRLEPFRELLSPAELAPLLPRRQASAHKGSFGHLLLLAGSRGMTGAALLAARGALRSGAGLVSACVPENLLVIFATALPELMTISLPNSPTAAGADDLEAVQAALTGKSALVMGPGLGTAPATAALVRQLYRTPAQPSVPQVLDADALNIMAADPELLSAPPGTRILTPHPGEMASLLGVTTAEVQQDRWQAAAELAGRHRVWVVLKGAGTVIAGPEGQLAVNSTGNPGMAAGGMGDVLAGLIGSLLAQGLPPWQAACLGVYVHGLAGDLLAAASGLNFGFTASELADKLPAAFGRLTKTGEREGL
ncbi:NAD(P)H-hydrate dehydratase [Desulfurivibrio dismutans]|uniref:NAD(P)H-hydrate dehydratase n=1 Tax=Desulfurivibrio dismutans TaxID=1398908 RepID=UPI0023DB9ACE|nr:NAD(P)H-hydrate dehydratase [Desulfurivibrio alkaliphilus]MDF1614477.1 NAD(P)H-hydrate dehydratase [Desulfurivibrio alkaliphilus]